MKPKFSQHCGMTCLGGSERRACSCKGPAQCELQSDPEFQHARNEAIARMTRFLAGALERRKSP